MDAEALTRKFLLAYESKELATIANMFHPEIILRDWNSEIIGKEDAIEEFGKNFEQAQNLKILIKTIYIASYSAAAEIEITVNHTEKLNVVDVLNFNSEGKILSIVAYRGL
jgi:hypothetical protein